MLTFRLFGRSPQPPQSDAGATGAMLKIDMDEVAGRRFAQRAVDGDRDGEPAGPLGKHSAGFSEGLDDAGAADGALAVAADDALADPLAEALQELAADAPSPEGDGGADSTSSWMSFDVEGTKTCPKCGAEVGFARRCPACGEPMYDAPIPDADDDPDDDGAAGAAEGPSDVDAGVEEEPAEAPAGEPPKEAEKSLDEMAAEHDKLVEAARQIRAQAAEEQVAAVQSRLLRDRRLMAEIDQIMREQQGEQKPPVVDRGPSVAPAAPGAEATPPPGPAPLAAQPSAGTAAAGAPKAPVADKPPAATGPDASVRQIRPGVKQAPQPSPNTSGAPAPTPTEGAPSMPEPIPFGNNGPAEQRAMRIMSGESARAGVYADLANATTLNGRTVIDFLMIDRPDVEPGVDEAVHQARIIMQPDAVVALRDMLTDHIERFYRRSEA